MTRDPYSQVGRSLAQAALIAAAAIAGAWLLCGLLLLLALKLTGLAS